MSQKPRPFTVGWAEWVALPELDLPAIKAKIDTGARTSALHAFQIEQFGPAHAPIVRFGIHPVPGRTDVAVYCSAAVVDRREVASSNGERETRFVIRTTLRMGEGAWPIEVTLANRESMTYRMLLGRQAIRSDVNVDPAASFLQPRLSYRTYRRERGHQLFHRALRIALLTRRPGSATNRRLQAAAAASGHVIEVLDTARMSLALEAAGNRLAHGGAPVAHYDAVIPRLVPDDGLFGLAALRQLELMGSVALNPADALERLRNPLATHQILAAHGVPIPTQTLRGGNAGRVGGQTPAPRTRFLVVGQEIFVPPAHWEGNGNIDASEGGHEVQGSIAGRASQALGLGLAGVDIGETDAGPVVLGIAGTPVLSGFRAATADSIALRLIAEIERRIPSWRRLGPAGPVAP